MSNVEPNISMCVMLMQQYILIFEICEVLTNIGFSVY